MGSGSSRQQTQRPLDARAGAARTDLVVSALEPAGGMGAQHDLVDMALAHDRRRVDQPFGDRI